MSIWFTDFLFSCLRRPRCLSRMRSLRRRGRFTALNKDISMCRVLYDVNCGGNTEDLPVCELRIFRMFVQRHLWQILKLSAALLPIMQRNGYEYFCILFVCICARFAALSAVSSFWDTKHFSEVTYEAQHPVVEWLLRYTCNWITSEIQQPVIE
jgi:hypothetical protein